MVQQILILELEELLQDLGFLITRIDEISSLL